MFSIYQVRYTPCFCVYERCFSCLFSSNIRSKQGVRKHYCFCVVWWFCTPFECRKSTYIDIVFFNTKFWKLSLQPSNSFWRFHSFKGTVSRDFRLLFFSWASFPPAPEYPIRTISIFFANSRRYSQVKLHHRYKWHRWQICHRCQQHPWQNMETISGCRLLRVNLKAKIIYILFLLPKGVQTK